MTDALLATREQILFARQPIYNRELDIIGYELLFRPSRTLVRDEDWNPDFATSNVLLHAFTELESEKVTENKLAFVNFTRTLIFDTPKINPKGIIIEVLEDLTPDEELFNALKLLVAAGYKIALDDFVYSPEWDDIIGISHYIKVDVLAMTPEQIEAQAVMLKTFDVELLAEKVENHQMYEYCKALGFTYFQGYFLCHPQAVRGRTIPSSRLAVLKLLADLQEPDIEISQLKDTVVRDPSLSTKLLKIFEASSYAHLPKIESIQHALTLLGLNQLRKWINLLALSKLDDKPNALLLATLNRARFCETLAKKANFKDIDRYFTIGLFSLLDAFFDIELDEILMRLPLTEELKAGLLNYEGDVGKVLKFVINYERAEWDKIDEEIVNIDGLDSALIETAYYESIAWASEISQSMF